MAARTRILIVSGRFNEMVTGALRQGCLSQLQEAGVKTESISEIEVPGCFEIPVVAATAARSGAFAAIIALGAVIRGETPHFDYVAGESARGLMDISVETGVPVIFGILTTDTIEQALSRSGLKGGNKGRDAALAALAMIKNLNSLRQMAKA